MAAAVYGYDTRDRKRHCYPEKYDPVREYPTTRRAGECGRLPAELRAVSAQRQAGERGNTAAGRARGDMTQWDMMVGIWYG